MTLFPGGPPVCHPNEVKDKAENKRVREISGLAFEDEAVFFIVHYPTPPRACQEDEPNQR
jgi:hypothetical protein